MPSIGKPALAFLIAASAIILAGCWHRETDQQRFIEAMNHGSAAQASQIWLNMDAKSRADFSHSEGMHPDMSSDEMNKQLSQHYQGETGADNSGQTIDRPAPYVHLGGLQSLPEWSGPSGAPPQAVTVPTQNAPSN
jgi:hypothetical protein